MKINFSGIGKKLGEVKDKVSDAAENAKLGEKFADAKKSFGDSMAKMKEQQAEHKQLSDEAKTPVEGAIARYQVIYLGGFPMKPQKKSDSLSMGLNILEDRFVFKPELLAKQQWFGEENFEVLYDSVIKFEIVKRQVSTTEALLSDGDTKSLEQMNNIEITYVNEGGDDFTLRVEMLTGITVYGQAEKCRELVDLLKEKQILKKLNKADQKDAAPAGQPDVLDQIEKLAKLKEAGILSEEEFAAKKAKLLETL